MFLHKFLCFFTNILNILQSFNVKYYGFLYFFLWVECHVYENIPFRLTNISDSFHSFGCIIKWFWESIRETLKKEIKVEKDEATQIIATSNDLQAREKDSCVLP